MKVDLLLYIHEDKIPILIQGAVVRWSGAHGIGVQFQSLASPHQERLNSTSSNSKPQPVTANTTLSA
jgi:hypothetical protein